MKRHNYHKISWWRYLKRFLEKHQWSMICTLWLITFVLGYVGSMKQLAANDEMRSFLDPFYRAIQLFMIDDSMIVFGPILFWELEAARFLAPLVVTYTLIATLAAVFHEKFQLFRLRFIRNHVVICGLGRKGMLLSKGFYEGGDYIVVIEQDQDNGMLEQCRDMGAIVLIGNTADRELLRSARVHKAKYLISVCGDDGTNAEVAVKAYEMVENRKGKVLTCFVHIVDPQLCNLLREREIVTEKVDSFRLEFFNIFDSGARALLNKYPLFVEMGEGQNLQPHILLVGMGRMGESIVVHTARNWWYSHNNTCERLRITIIDREAERKTKLLCQHYPQLERACNLVPLQIDIHSPEFQQGKFLFNDQGICDTTSIYVCLDNDSLGLIVGLTLHQMVREEKMPIIVRMTHDAGLATIMRGIESSGGSFDNIYAFGLLDQTCNPDLLIGGTHDVLARAIHEEYVRNQEKEGQTPKTNPSMVPWDKLSDDLRESNRLQADHIGVKLKIVGYGITSLTDWDAELLEFSHEEIEKMAEMEHERWVIERTSAGWKAGPKNVEKKASPYLVPWTELHENIRDIDRNTVIGMPAFLARAGFQIYGLKKEEK